MADDNNHEFDINEFFDIEKFERRLATETPDPAAHDYSAAAPQPQRSSPRVELQPGQQLKGGYSVDDVGNIRGPGASGRPPATYARTEKFRISNADGSGGERLYLYRPQGRYFYVDADLRMQRGVPPNKKASYEFKEGDEDTVISSKGTEFRHVGGRLGAEKAYSRISAEGSVDQDQNFTFRSDAKGDAKGKLQISERIGRYDLSWISPSQQAAHDASAGQPRETQQRPTSHAAAASAPSHPLSSAPGADSQPGGSSADMPPPAVPQRRSGLYRQVPDRMIMPKGVSYEYEQMRENALLGSGPAPSAADGEQQPASSSGDFQHSSDVNRPHPGYFSTGAAPADTFMPLGTLGTLSTSLPEIPIPAPSSVVDHYGSQFAQPQQRANRSYGAELAPGQENSKGQRRRSNAAEEPTQPPHKYQKQHHGRGRGGR